MGCRDTEVGDMAGHTLEKYISSSWCYLQCKSSIYRGLVVSHGNVGVNLNFA